MKKLLFILMLICSLQAMVEASVIVWNPETRTLSLYGTDKTPWLVGGTAQIKFTGGMVISTSDKRFEVTVNKLNDRLILSGSDNEKTLDWEMVLISFDNSSLRIDMTIYNRSTQPLNLDQIYLLSGKLTGSVDSARNRCLVNGMHSWSGADVTRIKQGTKISFTGSPGKYETRKFVTGPVGDVKIK